MLYTPKKYIATKKIYLESNQEVRDILLLFSYTVISQQLAVISSIHGKWFLNYSPLHPQTNRGSFGTTITAV